MFLDLSPWETVFEEVYLPAAEADIETVLARVTEATASRISCDDLDVLPSWKPTSTHFSASLKIPADKMNHPLLLFHDLGKWLDARFTELMLQQYTYAPPPSCV